MDHNNGAVNGDMSQTMDHKDGNVNGDMNQNGGMHQDAKQNGEIHQEAKQNLEVHQNGKQNGETHQDGNQNGSSGISLRENWYHPSDTANDLKSVDLPPRTKEEILAMSWEYARSVIPHYSNWKRYVAFQRIFIMGIIAEFRGELVDVEAGDDILGYNMQDVLDKLFKGTPGHESMCREFRAFMLVTSEKTSSRRDGELFRRYVNALSRSPRQWFRMRDTDALARFTIAAALAVNDLDTVWFTDEQFEILTELGNTLYDAVAFFKHRSEGETNSTFAYVPAVLRVPAFHQAREVLFALDVAWAERPELAVVTNFLRFFGGPLFMMMRRYRFVEENLTIGKPEDESVVAQTRQNYKLWNRIDARSDNENDSRRYVEQIRQKDKLMFDGLSDFLEAEAPDQQRCTDCKFRHSYGAETYHEFGGSQLCHTCKQAWRTYVEDFPTRAIAVFPELGGVLIGHVICAA